MVRCNNKRGYRTNGKRWQCKNEAPKGYKTCNQCRATKIRSYRKNWYKVAALGCKHNDIKAGRTVNDPLTGAKILRMWQKSQKCYYCDKQMQVKNRRAPDGCTIERLDNNSGHSKSNCVLACFRCNCKHKKRYMYPRKMVDSSTQTTGPPVRLVESRHHCYYPLDPPLLERTLN